MPPQVRPRLHGAAGRAPHHGQHPALGRLKRAVFRKEGPASSAFASEFEGLQALRAAGVNAPEPYACGETFIEMQRLRLGARPDWPALARMIAKLHRNTGERFGWASDNWIGLAPQKNAWSNDWPSFFWEFRLLPQLSKANLLEEAKNLNVSRFFENYRPVPSLLHGDLWNGNIGFTPGGPVVFDPAVYYGDREADLAMTELFGGFPGEFYASYNELFPLDAGYRNRKHLYNLYHLLNHLNLFGSGYRARVHATLDRLARAL
ncbi:MAG: fructosamine kinase family protein [Pseudomonadota bacterium]